MSRIFDRRDLSSHTFRKNELGNSSGNEDSLNTNFPPTPSSYTNQTRPDFDDLTPTRVASSGRHSIELGNKNEPREKSV